MEHTILRLVNDISNSFEKREHIIFFYLSKAFDVAYHKKLISKLEH